MKFDTEYPSLVLLMKYEVEVDAKVDVKVGFATCPDGVWSVGGWWINKNNAKSVLTNLEIKV